jgi:hypothetical protein
VLRQAPGGGAVVWGGRKMHFIHFITVKARRRGGPRA